MTPPSAHSNHTRNLTPHCILVSWSSFYFVKPVPWAGVCYKGLSNLARGRLIWPESYYCYLFQRLGPNLRRRASTNSVHKGICSACTVRCNLTIYSNRQMWSVFPCTVIALQKSFFSLSLRVNFFVINVNIVVYFVTIWMRNGIQSMNYTVGAKIQGCGSVFIWYGSGSSILGWIPIRIRIREFWWQKTEKIYSWKKLNLFFQKRIGSGSATLLKIPVRSLQRCNSISEQAAPMNFLLKLDMPFRQGFYAFIIISFLQKTGQAYWCRLHCNNVSSSGRISYILSPN